MIQTPEGFIASHPAYMLPLPPKHRYPMEKYELLPQQLLREGIVEEKDFFEPAVLERKHLLPVHDSNYVEKVLHLQLNKKEVREMGFPQSRELIERELRIAQGTIQLSLKALENSLSFNIAGGTHHAGYDFGRGFCVFNDQAIAAAWLLNHTKIKKILIVDLDVHQGNGTANIFKDEERVFTFSAHGRKNYPFKKEISDFDLGFEDGTKGEEYLEKLNSTLKKIIPLAKPDFIFFQAGVDVLENDRMGRLQLTIEDCRERDALIFEFCKQYGLPVEVSMGGGYSKQLANIINAHANTYKEGLRILK